MTAMPAEKLRSPRDLYAPADFDEKHLAALLEHLTPDGARRFAQDMMEALATARAEDDLRPVNYVFESWYRTLLFKSRPRSSEVWEKAQAVELPRLSLEDIRKRRAARHTA